ncbi:hypothetical protein AB1Y20_001749 [Prymnesium parvum]|uniref:Rab-GAP TBC domain-containing protein n=1 Tax=Prymnesium parvum TaxID=97485 RepID=A0AB34K9I9_PRYPA
MRATRTSGQTDRSSRRLSLHEPSDWRALALTWQRAHAPSTTYASLVRSADVEISNAERAAVRKDISRSRPTFFETYAPAEFDVELHSRRLERVLCAWAQYDQEIGYVQAMNLVASTLLLLLEGDEEGAFWVLVTLLRQLPSQFYSRAPVQLLGFWTEVEVLSQLASRLLGLDGLRNALLQVSSQWLLEWWLGTVPLRLLVPVWDHMLRNAGAMPSMLNLQISLVMLQLLHPQLKNLCASNEDDLQVAFTLLHNVHLPEGHPEWLLERALQIPLNEGAVQEMRERLRVALLERAHEEPWVPSPLPLPEVFSKPLPLLRPPTRSVSCCCGGASLPASVLSALAAAVLVMSFAFSLVLWAFYGSRKVEMVTVQVDLLVCLLVLCLAALVGLRWRWSRPAAAMCTFLGVPYATVEAVTTATRCWAGLHRTPHWVSTHTANVTRAARLLARLVPDTAAQWNSAEADGTTASMRLPPPPPPSVPVGPSCSLFWWWPLVLCGLLAVAALMQTLSAWGSRRSHRSFREALEPLSPQAARIR